MATRLLLLADTHLPTRARDLPAEVWRAVEEADLVLHAGDWVDVRLLDELEARSARLVACWGNNDHGELREGCPRSPASRSRASASAWSTRPGRRRAARSA